MLIRYLQFSPKENRQGYRWNKNSNTLTTVEAEWGGHRNSMYNYLYSWIGLKFSIIYSLKNIVYFFHLWNCNIVSSIRHNESQCIISTMASGKVRVLVATHNWLHIAGLLVLCLVIFSSFSSNVRHCIVNSYLK